MNTEVGHGSCRRISKPILLARFVNTTRILQALAVGVCQDLGVQDGKNGKT